MASQPIRFLPLRPESAVAALEWFPPVATRSQPLQRRVIRLFPLRDQGVAGSNPVSPTNTQVAGFAQIHLRRIWLFFAYAITRRDLFSRNFNCLRESRGRLAPSQGAAGSQLKPKARNLEVLSPSRGLLVKAPHHRRSIWPRNPDSDTGTLRCRRPHLFRPTRRRRPPWGARQ